MTLPPPKKEREKYCRDLDELITRLASWEDALVISTDGSRQSVRGTKRTGAGIVISHTDVYDRESLAIAFAMRVATRSRCTNADFKL
jgi:hypothetical protein